MTKLSVLTIFKLAALYRASRASSIKNSITVRFNGALELSCGIWGDFWHNFWQNVRIFWAIFEAV